MYPDVHIIKEISDRIVYLIIKLKRITLKIIQVYASTFAYPEEDVDVKRHHESIQGTEKSTNAKLGKEK